MRARKTVAGKREREAAGGWARAGKSLIACFSKGKKKA